MARTEADDAVEEVAQSSYGRLVAYLASTTSDIAAAEDALADAFEAALRTWPQRGIPDRPASWMLTAAKRSLIGSARRRDVAQRALPTLMLLSDERSETDEVSSIPDKRLELLFACAHPAIDPSLHAPLMLQTVLGLDAVRIGAAFLVRPSTLGQRLVRAKRKIRDAGVPFTIPRTGDLPGRAEVVLDAIYAIYGTGWDDPLGSDPRSRDLVPEALRLAQLISELLPDNAEAHGLAALMLHSDARATARRSPNGAFIALAEQDVDLWSAEHIGAAEQHLEAALLLGDLGPFQILGAIQSVHNRRALTGTTDWLSIAKLYDGLVAIDPTTGARVARAAAWLEAAGPSESLHHLQAIDADRVATYQPYWVVLGETLARTGATTEATAAARRAVGLTTDAAVQRYLRERFGMELDTVEPTERFS